MGEIGFTDTKNYREFSSRRNSPPDPADPRLTRGYLAKPKGAKTAEQCDKEKRLRK